LARDASARGASPEEGGMSESLPAVSHYLQPSLQTQDVLPLVAQVRPLARSKDPATSKAAAIEIADKLPEYQRLVLSAYTTYGAMTAGQAENLPCFKETLGFSTVRKRVSELQQRGFLYDTGRRIKNSTVYAAKSSSNTTPEAA
jgi:hypothetical protein